MWKKYAHNIIWILFAASFLLLPVADTRPFAIIPLYPLDFFYGALVFGSVILCEWRIRFSSLWIALSLLGVSVLYSWFVNGATLTGLGQIKSWMLFPACASLGVALTLRQFPQRDINFLRIWFAGLIALGVITVPYWFARILTFDGRLQGPFTSPNFLAFFLFPGVLLSIYWFSQTQKKTEKTLLCILGLLFVFLLFLTHSFGGWLALGTAITWYTLKKEDGARYRKQLFWGGVILLCMIGGEALTSNKLQSLWAERSSLASRQTIWQVAVTALQDHPVSGIGMGRFQEVYLTYQSFFPPYLEWAVPQPHNILLALWLQCGILGLLAMSFLVSTALFRHQKNTEEEQVLQALFVGVLVYGIFDTPLFGNALALVWWSLLVMLLFPLLPKELEDK